MNMKEIWIVVLIFKSLIKPHVVPFIPGTPWVATLHFTYWVYQCRFIRKLSEVQCEQLLHCQSLVWYLPVQLSQTIILSCLIHLTDTEQVGLVVTYFEYPWICLRPDSSVVNYSWYLRSYCNSSLCHMACSRLLFNHLCRFLFYISETEITCFPPPPHNLSTVHVKHFA
jgi:hypothetical protein